MQSATYSRFRLILAYFSVLILCGMFAQPSSKPESLPFASSNLPPDARYKTDILLVVAHPDDDLMVDAYLAKVIDEDKRVSVLYMTRGRAGQNFVGNEQGLALADEREMEARNSLAFLGIVNVWFLNGPDVPGPDVLHSLEAWGDGTKLERVVRIIRLTRPEVIMTMLPEYVVGENHTNHQAAGVIATEAFDLAGNPLAFPEQVEAPRDHLGFSNYGEGLRPWQPKKLYYFSDSIYTDFYKGNGPRYSTTEVSAVRGKSYAQLAYEAGGYYKTQDGQEGGLSYFEKPNYFILGKSLVGGTPGGDIFEGITTTPIPYVRARGYVPPVRPMLAVELGGPWAFYSLFWPAHNIERVAKLFPPQALCLPGQSLWVPLVIYNDTSVSKQVALHPNLPSGWTEVPEPMLYQVGAHDSYPISFDVSCPAVQKATWQNLTWRIETVEGESSAVTLHVNWMDLKEFLSQMQ